MAYALSMKTCQGDWGGRPYIYVLLDKLYGLMYGKNAVSPYKSTSYVPPPPYIFWCLPIHTTIYCGMRQKIAFFGSVPLYIVVQGIKLTPRESIQPQYIVVGNVDKTFLDYIIIAKIKRLTMAFCAFSRLKISFRYLTNGMDWAISFIFFFSQSNKGVCSMSK
jgi:hypothetical protein